MFKKIIFALPFIFLLALSSEVKSQKFYASLDNGDIYLVDISNCTSTKVVSTNFTFFWYDIAICDINSTKMYGVSSYNDLYEIDLTTGAYTLLDSTFNTFVANDIYYGNSLVCDGNGSLYMATYGKGGIFKFNLNTKTWTQVGLLPTYNSSGDLTFYDGKMYLTTNTDKLLEIDTIPFTVKEVAGISITGVLGAVTVRLNSLCSPVVDYKMIASAYNDIYYLNPLNGVTTTLCNDIVPGEIYGLASAAELDGEPKPITNVDFSYTLSSTCDNVGIRFSNVSVNADSYKWQFGDGVEASDISPTHVYPYSSSFSVTLIGYNANGCNDTITKNINIKTNQQYLDSSLIKPNVFTPNGDGINDLFSITMKGADYSGCTKLQIYSRWGVLVFETNDYNKAWDGKNSGGPDLPSGVYYYVYVIKDLVFKGFVTVLR